MMRFHPLLLGLIVAATVASPVVAGTLPAVEQTETGVRAAFTLLQAAMDRDDRATSLRLADAVLKAVRDGGLQTLLAEALQMKGEALMGSDKDAEAKRYFLNAMGLAQSYGDRRVHANLLNDLGILIERDGNWDGAHQYYQESLEIARTLSDSQLLDSVTFDLGSIECLMGEMASGSVRIEAVLASARARQDRLTIAKTLVRLADVERDMKQAVKAEASANEALSLSRETGLRVSEQGALRMLAFLALDKGDLKVAEARLKDAHAVAVACQDPWALAGSSFDLGGFYLGQGRTEEAREELLAARKTFKHLGKQDVVDKIQDLLDKLGHGKSI